MPQWGLDKDMRQSMPWELPEHWLEPGKVITDPIHGDIYVTTLEQSLVDTAAFQRLRRVKQLSTTHLVYPGATHTRFAHSLGALRVVQDLFDVAWGQRNGNHAVEDLLAQWDHDRQREEDGETDVEARERIRVRYLRRAERHRQGRLHAERIRRRSATRSAVRECSPPPSAEEH
jgi:hypothetical protein